ncbi:MULTISPECIES: sigma-70 family RNA polymerase sigma factor [Nocardia]|uniref:Sigma-70 family RNA polymerase sigma factor n=1 Tax=Nocardia implantans TaxID=3108168 RepID=A0ABU6ARR3_9NOCA|nr:MULTISPECIES: sigma-70 family RNA polymerase sigma factor [unclassified Nocardia]MBF6191528.1 sigma-70 family RNA polymerase sigma factor [Nocardia beijingensis]MEA3528165.1 sigma-70 family RNA polymerase sigma factor [Nocardia sp. CDC192]MEB3510085.1 sigma-70 family RNA polymerase sigma factor [Nocardia sp. CDC186]
MPTEDGLAGDFEAQRGHLHAVAYRMLGSPSEADDAVQETWLRLVRHDVDDVRNLPGWLTTVVSRICLDMLRARAARREEPLDHPSLDRGAEENEPEGEAVLIESVGRALLVVLDRLGPDERVAFVLHDLFAVPFDEIAPIVGRTTPTTKKLASRARQRVRGVDVTADPERTAQRHVVEAFLRAARGGDLDGLLTVLAPDVVRTADAAALPAGVATTVRGAASVAAETVLLRRRSQVAALALVDGHAGIVVAPHGRLLLALTVTVRGDRVAGYRVIADPSRLRELPISLLHR